MTIKKFYTVVEDTWMINSHSIFIQRFPSEANEDLQACFLQGVMLHKQVSGPISDKLLYIKILLSFEHMS